MDIKRVSKKGEQQLTSTTLKATMECPEEMALGSFNTSFCLQMAVHVLQKETKKGSNFVFSPFSFHSMLNLIAVGSKGSTLEQLLFFLGLKNVNELNSLASKLVKLAFSQANDGTGGPTISFLNSAWIDQRFHLKTSFKEVVEDVYGATTKSVDFVNKANQVVSEVNSWAVNATKGLIKDLLPHGCLGKDTALVLANALYFKGEWDRKFDASKTEIRDFYLLDGQVVQAPFMTVKRYEKTFYASYDGYKVLKLPYQSGRDERRFSMYFFLPDATDGLENLVEMLKSNHTALHGDVNFRQEVLHHFWIPRFKFSFDFEASNTMKELGLELPFQDVGEFTEMVDSPQSPVLSEMFHKSFIEVNEEGTEAAASTAARFRRQSRRVNPPTFVADHPFMFTIKEENSGVVFFVGAVLNPILVS